MKYAVKKAAIALLATLVVAVLAAAIAYGVRIMQIVEVLP